MTFPRQRHAGTGRIFRNPFLSQSPIPFADSAIAVPNRSSKRSALRLTVAGLSLLVAPLSVPAVVQAAKAKKATIVSPAKKLPGAPAWTLGSQTYLRAGYSTDTPVVAKVAHGTKVFVWGKYNGWYRVETSDHKFAWVHHELLNCPKSDKVAYLAPSKARVASARSARQRLYGSPEDVREHQAKYGLGVESRKLKIAKAASTAKAPAKIAKAPAKIAKAPAPRIAARPVVVTPKAQPVASASRVVTPRAAAVAASVVSVQQVRWERDEVALSPSRPSRTSPSRTSAMQSAPGERPAFATERKEGAVAATPAANLPNVVVPNVAAPNAPVGVTRVDSAPVVRAPIATKATPVKAAPAKKVAKAPAKKAPVKTAAKAPAKAPAPKLSAAQIRAQKRQAASYVRRNSLRARRGTPRMAPPPVAVKGVRPISPSELLRAREAFLAKQRNAQGNVQANNSENNGRVEPMSLSTPEPAAPISAPIVPLLQRSIFSFQAPQFQDVVYDATAETTDESNAGVEKLAPLLAADDLNAAQWMALAKKAPKAAPSRGGSPRDFANGRGAGAGKQNLGESLANQALTYRGTPYRYGASSPSRGFDCSGLIYYCLRQRGYSPPRSAAGLASYGKPVKRDELKSGDIVLFSNTYKRGVSHVGIYVGNNNFVHAPNSGSRIRVDSLGSSYYSKKYHSARRAG